MDVAAKTKRATAGLQETGTGRATATLIRGRYEARTCGTADDLRRAQSLRQAAFHGTTGHDADDFDDRSRHVLVEDRTTGQLVCCYRVLPLAEARHILTSYSAQFYDLSALSGFPGPLAEVGRFCLAPGLRDPDVLRLAWAMLTRLVDRDGVRLLFGCASFAGTDPAPFEAAFSLMRARHLAPHRWMPRPKAPRIHAFASALDTRPDPGRALRVMPPLLRSYLSLGGWVSDHAVIDPDMNTLHVFTGVEIAAIPAARRRVLRASAA